MLDCLCYAMIGLSVDSDLTIEVVCWLPATVLSSIHLLYMLSVFIKTKMNVSSADYCNNVYCFI